MAWLGVDVPDSVWPTETHPVKGSFAGTTAISIKRVFTASIVAKLVSGRTIGMYVHLLAVVSGPGIVLSALRQVIPSSQSITKIANTTL